MSTTRTGLSWAAVAATTPVFAGAAALAGRISPGGSSPHRIARAWARLLTAVAGVRLTVEGPVPGADAGAMVLMSNHVSSLDIPVLLAALDPATRPGFLAKSSLFRVPFLGGAMAVMGCIPVDRENRRTAGGMLVAALAVLRSGGSLVAFPEGTWGQGDALLPFHRGAFLLAARGRAPIVPIGLDGPQRVLPASARRLHPGPVTIRFGAPIATARRGTSSLPDLVAGVRAEIERLRRAP